MHFSCYSLDSLVILVAYVSMLLILAFYIIQQKHGYSECYSEASDHEEAETTEIPPPPYSEQTVRDSVDAPGSTHQVSVQSLNIGLTHDLFISDAILN